MNNTEEIVEDLSAFLSKVAAIPPEEITTDDSLDTLGVDSAATISLSAHLDEHFGVIADADDLSKTATIKQIADFVRRHCEG